MKVITWKYGSDPELDQIFDHYRQLQFIDTSHRLSKNYSKDFYKFSIAHTIAFNNKEEPEICSSIASRSCWPSNVYRVMNRLWKTKNHRIKHSTFISEAMVGNLISQIKWLEQNTDFKLFFISREKDGWRDWSIQKFKEQFSINFKKAEGKYLTCPNESDDSCWQYLIYQGDHTVFSEWKHKL